MKMINDWAQRWNIPPEALADLRNYLGLAPLPAPTASAGTEAEAQAAIRLESCQKGGRLWRNNVGAGFTPEGRPIRYGLANDSARVNRSVKSSDLVGITPVLIQPEHVGRTLGQFTAREVKKPGWKFRGTAREEAQLRFLLLVISLGGDAAFATGPGTL